MNSMNKHDKEKLFLSIDGALEEAEERELSKHLSECPDCRRIYDEMKTVKEDMMHLKKVSAPPDFAAGVLRQLKKEKEEKRTSFVLFPWAAAAAAGIMIVSLLVFYSQEKPGKTMLAMKADVSGTAVSVEKEESLEKEYKRADGGRIVSKDETAPEPADNHKAMEDRAASPAVLEKGLSAGGENMTEGISKEQSAVSPPALIAMRKKSEDTRLEERQEPKQNVMPPVGSDASVLLQEESDKQAEEKTSAEVKKESSLSYGIKAADEESGKTVSLAKAKAPESRMLSGEVKPGSDFDVPLKSGDQVEDVKKILQGLQAKNISSFGEKGQVTITAVITRAQLSALSSRLKDISSPGSPEEKSKEIGQASTRPLLLTEDRKEEKALKPAEDQSVSPEIIVTIRCRVSE
jgi:hypothetical protein